MEAYFVLKYLPEYVLLLCVFVQFQLLTCSGERIVTVSNGTNATFTCETHILNRPVDLHYTRSNSDVEVQVYTSGFFRSDDFVGRLTVHVTQGQYLFHFFGVVTSDSGTFTCIENAGFGTRENISLNVMPDVEDHPLPTEETSPTLFATTSGEIAERNYTTPDNTDTSEAVIIGLILPIVLVIVLVIIIIILTKKWKSIIQSCNNLKLGIYINVPAPSDHILHEITEMKADTADSSDSLHHNENDQLDNKVNHLSVESNKETQIQMADNVTGGSMMTRNHKSQLRRAIPLLIENMEPETVIRILYSLKVLTLEDEESIKENGGATKKKKVPTATLR